MTKRYLGNIITQNPTAPAGPYESDAAPGVWSLAEAFAYTKAGLWPTAGNSLQLAIFVSGSGSLTNALNVTTAGNATSFGSVSPSQTGSAGAGSSTRMVIAAAAFSGDKISYLTYATAGNTTDFGNLTVGRTGIGGGSSETRALFMGGYSTATSPETQSTTDYVTIASTGNAIDFGDLNVAASEFSGTANSTRALGVGGTNSGGSKINNIQYFTIASTGNAADFGDRTVTGAIVGSAANSTRALMGGRDVSSNVVDFVTIASTGNATDFGDLTAGKVGPSAAAGLTKAFFVGGTAGSASKEIDFFTIASTGNASDFGDMVVDTGGGVAAACNVAGGTALGNP